MAQKKKSNDSYNSFSESLKTGVFENLYFFHGEERYLLEHSLAQVRRLLCPDGLNGFNYKRFEGKEIRIDDLDDAINTLPVFAERTLIEVHDLDVFKGKGKTAAGMDNPGLPPSGKGGKTSENTEKQQLAEILSDIPEYACVVFVFDTIPFKPDMRQKLDKSILESAFAVEFCVQEQAKLTNWIRRRFEAAGKQISKADAEYLTLITDGHMSALAGEIEKVAAYSDGAAITRVDIDAVVVPAINAFAYKLTDAILSQKHEAAFSILDDLFLMREPAQKIIFSISLKMRQFLAARICVENAQDKAALMKMAGIKFDFQAGILMETARNTTLSRCRNAVLLCSEAAYDLNSAPEPEARLVELVMRLALPSEGMQI